MTLLQRPEVTLPPEEVRQWAQEFKGSYLVARQEWLERYGDYVAAARNWRRTAQLALIAAILAIGGLIWTSSQSQVVPYVVRIDRLGGIAAVDRAERMDRPDNALITAQLARWVSAVRTVYVDAAAQRSLINEGYAMINRLGDGFGVLNDYMRANDPFKRAETETVAVDVQSVLPIAGDSWRIEWREETRGRDGVVLSTYDYLATVTISFSPPREEVTLRANPLGLYISVFHWTRRL